jgi:hypothetical protein
MLHEVSVSLSIQLQAGQGFMPLQRLASRGGSVEPDHAADKRRPRGHVARGAFMGARGPSCW